MKNIKIFAMLLSLACTTGFVACDDGESVKQALQSPSLSTAFSDYQSLDFKWDAIPNTIQYGYKLYDPEGLVVEAGVTKNTSASFTGLQSASTYKLLVWAFAGLDTDYSTSPAAELTASTEAIKKLATPANLTVTDNRATWDGVENAESYYYTISNAKGALVVVGTEATTSLRISGLEEGDYTLSVIAITANPGYVASDPASVNFHFGTISGGSSSLTIDDLAGAYTTHLTGWSYLENSDYTEEEINYNDYTATIEKIDESTISLDGLYWTGVPVTGTVDLVAMTITFQPQDYYGYTFAGYTPDDSVVATIDTDGTIKIEDFGLWWSGTWYLYGYATLTPQNETRAISGNSRQIGKKAPQKGLTRSSRK